MSGGCAFCADDEDPGAELGGFPLCLACRDVLAWVTDAAWGRSLLPLDAPWWAHRLAARIQLLPEGIGPAVGELAGDAVAGVTLGGEEETYGPDGRSDLSPQTAADHDQAQAQMVVVTVRLPPRLLAELRATARRRGVPWTSFLRDGARRELARLGDGADREPR